MDVAILGSATGGPTGRRRNGCRDEVVFRAMGLSKSFGATRALASCSLDLRRGEVHAVIGENGSGKSTLVKIVAGIQRPDGGTLALGDPPGDAPRSPRAALESGIATVFQDVLVAGSRSVLENIWLGTDGLFRSRLSRGEKVVRAQAALTELLPSPPRVTTAIELLSLAERQACCIARALVRKPRILVLDEATSALDVATCERLFATLDRLKADGVAVIVISHRLDEIEQVADRITVLRGGESVGTLGRGELSARELVRLMSSSQEVPAQARRTPLASATGRPVLRTRGVRLRRGVGPIDLELRGGEIVGLAGLEDHGQGAFLRTLAGAGSVGGQVTTETPTGPVAVRSTRQAAAHGIAYVPRDRRADGLFGSLTTLENFAVPTLRRDRRGLLLDWRRTEQRLASYGRQLEIRLGSSRDLIGTLSGGNQQKIVLARWLAAAPRILLLDDPTRGIDVASKQDIHRLLAGLAAEGVAIVMLSTELDELIGLADRVLVFREHEVFIELPRRALSRQSLVSGFFGRAADVHA